MTAGNRRFGVELYSKQMNQCNSLTVLYLGISIMYYQRSIINDNVLLIKMNLNEPERIQMVNRKINREESGERGSYVV